MGKSCSSAHPPVSLARRPAPRNPSAALPSPRNTKGRMRAGQTRFIIGLSAVIAAASGALLRSQEGAGAGGAQAQARKFLAPPTQVVAIRAARFFDAKSGSLLNNQVVLIRGDRIADVGPAVQIPPEARVLNLGSATVLPGMI